MYMDILNSSYMTSAKTTHSHTQNDLLCFQFRRHKCRQVLYKARSRHDKQIDLGVNNNTISSLGQIRPLTISWKSWRLYHKSSQRESSGEVSVKQRKLSRISMKDGCTINHSSNITTLDWNLYILRHQSRRYWKTYLIKNHNTYGLFVLWNIM